MSTQQTVTVGLLAKICNITPANVRELTDKGKMFKAERGQYYLWSSITGYITYLQERALGVKDADVAAGYKTLGEDNPRRRTEFAKAELAELDLLARKNELFPASVIAECWDDMALRTRTKIQNIPHKAAPLLAGKTQTAPQIKAVLEKITDEALHEIANIDVASIARKSLDKFFGSPASELPSAAATDR